MTRIIMIDDEGYDAKVIRYARTLTMTYKFDVGPNIPQMYDSLSEGIFTDVDDFLDYVDYLSEAGDPDAQRERLEIRAFIVDQKMPPGDRLVRDFPDMQLAKNHNQTGTTLMKYLYKSFTNEVKSNSIHFFMLSIVSPYEAMMNEEDFTCPFLPKAHEFTSNCDYIVNVLGR